LSTRLIPAPSLLTRPFWEAARERRLALQRCERCSRLSFPPRARCPSCGACELRWQDVSGAGTVYSFTVVHRPPHAVFTQQCPFVVAIVELAEGPRMTSNIVNCDAAAVYVGMPVRVEFEAIDDSDLLLPLFTPA
jgi:uncharacterized OB-fold protein